MKKSSNDYQLFNKYSQIQQVQQLLHQQQQAQIKQQMALAKSHLVSYNTAASKKKLTQSSTQKINSRPVTGILMKNKPQQNDFSYSPEVRGHSGSGQRREQYYNVRQVKFENEEKTPSQNRKSNSNMRFVLSAQPQHQSSTNSRKKSMEQHSMQNCTRKYCNLQPDNSTVDGRHAYAWSRDQGTNMRKPSPDMAFFESGFGNNNANLDGSQSLTADKSQDSMSSPYNIKVQINNRIQDMQNQYNKQAKVDPRSLVRVDSSSPQIYGSKYSQNSASKDIFNETFAQNDEDLRKPVPQKDEKSVAYQNGLNQSIEMDSHPVHNILDQQVPNKRDVYTDKNDQVIQDINGVLESFEKVFVAYINENYRTFTEQDLQNLIQVELKQSLNQKITQLTGNPGYANMDPQRIKFIVQKANELSTTNEEIRDAIHSLGVLVNQLAQSSVNLKQKVFITAEADQSLRDIAMSIDKLNHLFNDVYLKVLENDTKINDVKITCKTAQSHWSYSQKFETLQTQYSKLEEFNLELKKQLGEQFKECRRLQEDFDLAKSLADKHLTEEHKVRNLEQMLEGTRKDNRELMQKAENLQVDLFSRDRLIDKLRHQLKHGVVAKGISASFDHTHPGAGGSIETGSLLSKVELAKEQQELLSAAQYNQLKWREHARTLIRLAQRFVGSMRALGTAVQGRKSQNEDEIALEKIAFEQNKRELQTVMENVQIELENTDLDVIRRGSKFMEPSSSKEHLDKLSAPELTKNNVHLLHNILKAQARSLSPRAKLASQKRPKRIPKLTEQASQTDGEGVRFECPAQAANIIHYKPQELIRLELENAQIKEEKDTMQGYVEELKKQIDHLLKCIQETNTHKFLKEMQEERDKKHGELVQRVKEDFIGTADSNSYAKSGNKKAADSKPAMTEQEKFESDMLDLKLAIKQTEELIALSKQRKLNQDDVNYEEPERTQFNPISRAFKDESPRPEVVEGEKIQSKWTELLQEKEDEINKLVEVRQRLEEDAQQLRAQVGKQHKEVRALQTQLEMCQQAKVDEELVTSLQGDNDFLREQNGRLQRDLHEMEEKVGGIKRELAENLTAAVRVHEQQYSNLERQLDQERGDYAQLQQESQAELRELGSVIEKKTELNVKLQADFNHLCTIRNGLVQEVSELKERLRGTHEALPDVQRTSLECEELKTSLARTNAALLRAQLTAADLEQEVARLKSANNDLAQQKVQSPARESSKVVEQVPVIGKQPERDRMEQEHEALVRELKLQITAQDQAISDYQEELVQLQSMLSQQASQVEHDSQKMKDTILKLKQQLKEHQEALDFKEQELQQLRQVADEKEDDFWKQDQGSNDESPKSGGGTAGFREKPQVRMLDDDDRYELDQLQDALNELHGAVENAKLEVVSQLSTQFKAELDTINKRVEGYIRNKIVSRQSNLMPSVSTVYLENVKIKQVGRVLDSAGEAYLLLEMAASLEDQIQKKPSQVIFVKEDNLEESALEFIRSYMPGTNQFESMLTRLDEESGNKQKLLSELRVELSHLLEERDQIQQSLLTIADGTPLDHADYALSSLQTENLEVRESNNKLKVENLEYRQRIGELNDLVTSLIRAKSGQEPDLNANDQQISYGKKTESLLGSPDPTRYSNVTVERADSEEEKTSMKETVMEHVRSNLRVFLMKAPVINSNNEVVLKVLFSLLNFSKQEIEEIEQARKRLPIYKIDKKNTAKAEKEAAKVEQKSGFLGTSGEKSSRLSGLFGRKSGGDTSK